MAGKQYLDDQGNPVAAPVYLDDNGEPRGGNPIKDDKPPAAVAAPAETSDQAAPELKNYGFTVPHMIGQGVEGVKELGGSLYQMGKAAVTKTPMIGETHLEGSNVMVDPKSMLGMATSGLSEEGAKAKEAAGQGRYVEAAGHGLASVLPMVGPWAAGLGEQAGSGDIGGAVARGGATMLAGKAGEKVFKGAMNLPNTVSDVRAASDPTELNANVRGRLAAGQVEAQKAIKNGRSEYLNRIEQKTAGIKAKDTANPTTTLQAEPISDAITQKSGEMNAEGRLRMPTVARIYDLVNNAAAEGPMTFERLQQLRSDIGQLTFNKNLPPVERTIAQEAYGHATNMMAQRAAQLGETDAFNRYNAEYSALKQLDHDTLNDMLSDNAKPGDFFRLMNDQSNNQVQTMLDRFGKHGDVVRSITKETHPLQAHLAKGGESSGFTGRMRAMMTQPGWAAAGAVAGKIPGMAVGMPWVGEMIGASKGAEFGSRVATARAMREGSPFALGAQTLREGGIHGILPEQAPWTSGAMDLPEEPLIRMPKGPAIKVGPVPESGTTAPKMGTPEPRMERRVGPKEGSPKRRSEDVASAPMGENVNEFVNNAAAQDLFDKDYDELSKEDQAKARAHVGRMYSQEAEPITKKMSKSMPRTK